MKARNAWIGFLLCGLAAAARADGQASMNGMHGMVAMPATAGMPGQGAMRMPLSEGVIRRIDLDAGKITIRHGELANLGMPAMTMTFAGDRAMLKDYKVGDRIRFRAECSSAGMPMVVRMAHAN
ncbi:MAG: copper-binding protein [Betaproteobacteria bacterium]|nr:copper-binding protein [Betaproteobacteria bacterium]